ncbi:MAG TPA: ATP-binding cassette domain-containing protein [Chitinophagaceae bacterium]|nr:ATP-binding cassette domain-containing protein [Chitinophagaceae bacterium]
MRISLTDAGKRYNREWIFRHLDQGFQAGQTYAIIGPNGSGKSTLLQVIAGSTALSEGKISMENVKDEDHYQNVSIAAPYLELIEEMSGIEFLQFHSGFKPFVDGMDAAGVLERVQLAHAGIKQIRYYSSGMKQRLKLAQCILSQSGFVLLDEPCTNLDETGITLYHSLIEEYTRERCVIVSSNDKVEYSFCEHRIEINKYK